MVAASFEALQRRFEAPAREAGLAEDYELPSPFQSLLVRPCDELFEDLNRPVAGTLTMRVPRRARGSSPQWSSLLRSARRGEGT